MCAVKMFNLLDSRRVSAVSDTKRQRHRYTVTNRGTPFIQIYMHLMTTMELKLNIIYLIGLLFVKMTKFVQFALFKNMT